MGNFISDTLGKMAANVTQSVVSALIVTAITTFLIINPGKKENTSGASGKDSANSNTTVLPAGKTGAVGQSNRVDQQSTETSKPESVDAGKSTNGARGTTPIALPATELKVAPPKAESPATEAAAKAYKDLPPETPAEQKLEQTITEGRAKGDSLASAHPQEAKAKVTKQEEKKSTKDVKKRADEVFDELDKEIEK